MTNFLSKLFGKKKDSAGEASEVSALIRELLEGVIEKANLALEFKIDQGDNELRVEFWGDDTELLVEREGQLLEALQLYIKRAVQHRLPEDKTNFIFDSQGYREESNQALVDLAEKLKTAVLEKNRSVYCRALPPKDRKIIHQYLAGDGRVKSKSVGEGLYKKIKIYPARASRGGAEPRSAST